MTTDASPHTMPSIVRAERRRFRIRACQPCEMSSFKNMGYLLTVFKSRPTNDHSAHSAVSKNRKPQRPWRPPAERAENDILRRASVVFVSLATPALVDPNVSRAGVH